MSTITPFIKRMRVQGGTMFTFSSATEDIGLNINERNNTVKMSHYALLDIPSISAPENLQQNRFNTLTIPGALESFIDSGNIKDGRVLVSESFQNYALNLEANLLNRANYNPNLLNSVSERVFWKWLKETGSIRWQDSSTGYFEEEVDVDASAGYNSVVKNIGQISAGSIRTDNFGTYNETYVLVPTSYGQTRVFFKQLEDDNYSHGIAITNGNDKILGRESYLKPHPDGLDLLAYYDIDASDGTTAGYQMQYDNSTGSWIDGWWTNAELISFSENSYYTDISTYLTTGIYNVDLQYVEPAIAFKRSKVDCLNIVYDIDELKVLYSDSTLTFDKMSLPGTNEGYSINDSFDFNAILIYYTVYNTTLDKVLATNLLGVLFLDSPSGNTTSWPSTEIIIPSITKLQSGASGFGTSYSFRINIKSDNMMDDTQAVIYDESTSAQTALEDFSAVFSSLEESVNILNQHTGTINFITQQYSSMQSNQTEILNQVANLQYSVNDITRDITGTENAIAMFSAGDDPLVDSSIYMKNGKIGFFTNNPVYPVQFDVSIKTKDITIENAIRDTSGNILLGYGSPLQIGSSTNYRQIDIYVGGTTPIMSLDTSGNVTTENIIAENATINGYLAEASLGTNFYWDSGYLEPSAGGGDVTQAYVDGSLNDIRAIYIPDSSLGAEFIWAAGYLNVDVSVIADGASITYVDGSLAVRDTSIATLNTLFSSYSLTSVIDDYNTLQDASTAWLNTNKLESSDLSGYSLTTAINAYNVLQDASTAWLNTNKYQTAGNGLTDSGVSVVLGTPATLTSATSNGLTSTSHTHAITTGIADNNIIKINHASVADNDYAKFTASGLEGRNYSEVAGDIGAVTNVTGASPIASSGGATPEITHVATAGNKHIPTAGASNQYLKYSASGTAVWATISAATDISGTLPANRGGTGIATPSVNSILTGGTSSALVAESGLKYISDTELYVLGDVSVNGNIYATGEIEGYSTSDERLKTNIQSFSALDIIDQLDPVKFNWNEKAKELNSHKTDDNNYGLIAQELETVLPELVHPIYDEYKGIDYVQLIPILVQSIKELKKEINELKNK